MTPEQIVIISSLIIMAEYNENQEVLDKLKQSLTDSGFSVEVFNEQVDKFSDSDYEKALIEVATKVATNQFQLKAARKRKAKENTNES